VEGDPVREAELAVSLCRRYDLDGYIANAEAPYEFDGFWKSAPFVRRFRELAPRAPLALSYIGDGHPHRALDFRPWLDDGATMMPQAYWATAATSLQPSIDAADRAGIPRSRLVPTVGSSGFADPYPAGAYARELAALRPPGFNVWLLESTTDDYLRALTS